MRLKARLNLGISNENGKEQIVGVGWEGSNHNPFQGVVILYLLKCRDTIWSQLRFLLPICVLLREDRSENVAACEIQEVCEKYFRHLSKSQVNSCIGTSHRINMSHSNTISVVLCFGSGHPTRTHQHVLALACCCWCLLCSLYNASTQLRSRWRWVYSFTKRNSAKCCVVSWNFCNIYSFLYCRFLQWSPLIF